MKILETILILAGLIILFGFIGLLLKPKIPVAKNATKSKSMTREPN
ncbi:MAG TPA: hypothetical protein VGM64_12780 [Lacunisphaera sp.]|jgi:hypothetical protein